MPLCQLISTYGGLIPHLAPDALLAVLLVEAACMINRVCLFPKIGGAARVGWRYRTLAGLFVVSTVTSYLVRKMPGLGPAAEHRLLTLLNEIVTWVTARIRESGISHKRYPHLSTSHRAMRKPDARRLQPNAGR